MIPYFVCRSYKMIIRVKPIRFAHKNRELCSDDGYPLKAMPYLGKSINFCQVPLRFWVFKELLEVVNDNKWHNLYFDKLFTSLSLLEDLKHHRLK